jgi:GT2 family glycosyltransferase
MFFVSCNCGVSRAAVIEVGGFDEAFTGWGEEDIELGYRLHNTGVTIVAVPDALVFHQQHVHNKSANAKSWARNYAYFVEKHRTLALYLRWQYLAGRISFDDFEKILIEYENGRLPSRDRMQIVCEYQAFLDAHSRDWPANEWVE